VPRATVPHCRSKQDRLRTVRLWLDDRRSPPDSGWEWVTTPDAAIALLKGGGVSLISFDHDLGFDGDRELSGYEVLLWIEEAVALHGYEPPEMLVHSANPPGHERLLRGIAAIERRMAERRG
jgi:Cyclic-phosphate processing Receiver domain